jgi:Uncharacterised protein family (UPF0175)
METGDVKLPSSLLRATNGEESNLSEEDARLRALELYREDKVSLGRAAEVCHMHWRLSWISPRSTVSPHYDIALKTWKKSASPRTVSKRDRRIRFVAACYSQTHPNAPSLLA